MDTPSPFATPAQREALTSPIRLEILGLFTAPGPLSVRELAERMGRSPSSIHYHVNLLAEVGILRETGSRPRGTRSEALYEPVRRTVRYQPTPHPGEADATLRTMVAAFRMAERDLEAALEAAEAAGEEEGDDSRAGDARPDGAGEGRARGTGDGETDGAAAAGEAAGAAAPGEADDAGEGGGGPGPLLVATRLHFRAGPELVEEVRGHLFAMLDLLEREAARPDPPDPSERVYSLTLALLPLRGRSTG